MWFLFPLRRGHLQSDGTRTANTVSQSPTQVAQLQARVRYSTVRALDWSVQRGREPIEEYLRLGQSCLADYTKPSLRRIATQTQPFLEKTAIQCPSRCT